MYASFNIKDIIVICVMVFFHKNHQPEEGRL